MIALAKTDQRRDPSIFNQSQDWLASPSPLEPSLAFCVGIFSVICFPLFFRISGEFPAALGRDATDWQGIKLQRLSQV